MRFLPLLFLPVFFFSACRPYRPVSRSAEKGLLAHPSLQTAHVGISIYEPATGRYWYDYHGGNYFVPASNTKIPTCYAAMKYLGDSLTGLRYARTFDAGSPAVVIRPSADPTLLHEDFPRQPVFLFLQQLVREKNRLLIYQDTLLPARWGNGWSWNDYDETYMAERSPLPVFGNTIRIRLRDTLQPFVSIGQGNTLPLFSTGLRYFDSLVNAGAEHQDAERSPAITIGRHLETNQFTFRKGVQVFSATAMPFVTNGIQTAVRLLQDTLNTGIGLLPPSTRPGDFFSSSDSATRVSAGPWQVLHSQPTDSLLRLMMHRSDNFFAEQSLLMVSLERLGIMNEAHMIDTLMKTDLKDLPQPPRWVDGSGLSRYNLFSPRDLVTLLDRMRTSFGMSRIKTIFPTGNEGTLSNYYRNASGSLFAKTGTLSGVVALSGFLYTRKNRLLIFSVLVNNHRASATDVRRAVEQFIEGIRNRY